MAQHAMLHWQCEAHYADHPHLILHLSLQSGFHHSAIFQTSPEFIFADFLECGSSTRLWFRPSASYPTERRVAPAAASEVCLVVSSACFDILQPQERCCTCFVRGALPRYPEQ